MEIGYNFIKCQQELVPPQYWRYVHCVFRWKNTLDYSIHFGEWRYEEDRTLWLTVQELGAGKVFVKILSETLFLQVDIQDTAVFLSCGLGNKDENN